ncbi:MAG TPA: YfiR family protein [Bryobacteraceae bacterium]|nr:YfiR family protein [Bryobacteraceae bacterium]
MLATTSTRLLASLAIAALAPVGSLAEEPEDELKAAVVLSFLRYGEWDQALPANATLTVGVVGRGEFAGVLRHSMEGKSANGHPVQVVELKSAALQHACQVIYFAGDNNPEIKAALESPALARVLTIGETRDFLDWGGAINLFVFHGHMAFEVSLDALERSGVSISSRLLRFGQIRSRK